MKKLSKSLNINKATIANLTGDEMARFKGGDAHGGGGTGATGTGATGDTGATGETGTDNTELYPCSNNCETESYIYNHACVGICNLSMELRCDTFPTLNTEAEMCTLQYC